MYYFCPCKCREGHFPPIQSKSVLNEPLHNCKKLPAIDPTSKCRKISSGIFDEIKLLKLSNQPADQNPFLVVEKNKIPKEPKIKIAIDVTPTFDITLPGQSKLGYREKFSLHFLIDEDREVSGLTESKTTEDKSRKEKKLEK